MKLLPDEELILSAHDGRIILTSHRIELNQKSWGNSSLESVFLEEISHISKSHASNITWLIIGIAFIVAGIVFMWQSDNDYILALGLIFGAIFIIGYFLSKRSYISITSTGGRPIDHEVRRMKKEFIDDLIIKVQEAKFLRVKMLHEKK